MMDKKALISAMDEAVVQITRHWLMPFDEMDIAQLNNIARQLASWTRMLAGTVSDV